MYYRKVKAYIEEFEMIREGDQVIAGVSGGGDSMAMLSCLRQYREEMDFSLKVVHVHHGIRGEEADRDAALVKQVCSDWQIPCQILRYDVPDLAKGWKVGTEEAGRRVRQEAFTLASKGCTARVRIALAHNQDDLAETVVHNLCRGTGIRGLSAMRPVSDPIIRPVLCLKKQQILEYLKEAGILYGQDSTNLSEEYTRNRIRHRILPLLQEQINPKASAHMAETAQILAAAGDYLFAQGECLLKQYASFKEGAYYLQEDFFRQESALVPYGLLTAFYQVSGRQQDFTSLHVKDIQKLVSRQVGRQVQLPYGMRAVRTYQGISLLPGSQHEDGKQTEEQLEEYRKGWVIPIPGSVKCPLGMVSARVFSYEGQKIEENKYTKWLDYDTIYSSLSVRTRSPGDYLVIDQKGNRKKLNRCFIDDKIPREKREQLPLIAAGEEIRWIIGGRISEKHKITQTTVRVIELQYQGGTIHE